MRSCCRYKIEPAQAADPGGQPDLPRSPRLALPRLREATSASPSTGSQDRRSRHAGRHPQSASGTKPLTNPGRARKRQQYIIDRMLENGFITPSNTPRRRRKCCTTARPSTPTLPASTWPRWSGSPSTPSTATRRIPEGCRSTPRSGPFRPEVAYRALRKGIAWTDYEAPGLSRPRGLRAAGRPGSRPPTARWPILSDHPDNDEVKPLSSWRHRPKEGLSGCFKVARPEVVENGLKPVTSGLNGKGPAQSRSAGARSSGCRQCRNTAWPPQLPRSKAPSWRWTHRDSSIRAPGGRLDYARTKFNHVTQAWRQPRSQLQAVHFISRAARSRPSRCTWSAACLLFDCGSTGSQLEPRTAAGAFGGPVTARRALAGPSYSPQSSAATSGELHANQWICLWLRSSPYTCPRALRTGSVPTTDGQRVVQCSPMAALASSRALIHTGSPTTGAACSHGSKTAPASDSDSAGRRHSAFLMSSLLGSEPGQATGGAQGTLKRPGLADQHPPAGPRDAWFRGLSTSKIVAIVWMGYDTPAASWVTRRRPRRPGPARLDQYVRHAAEGASPSRKSRPPGRRGVRRRRLLLRRKCPVRRRRKTWKVPHCPASGRQRASRRQEGASWTCSGG